MKYLFKKSASVLIWVVLAQGAASVSYSAETVCNDNGGAGWPFAVSSTTNINIPYQFGDVSTAFDVDVSVDISKPYVGDLTARVTSPQGTTVWLFERPGTVLDEFTATAPWGCNQDDIVVTFDDEAAAAGPAFNNTDIENVCGGGTPSISGTYLPHVPTAPNIPAPNVLSSMDGEDPSGNWAFQMVHVAPFDPGTLNEVCITTAFAAVSFDKWVSTNNTCSDSLDALSVAPGTDVYFCYTAANPGTETFNIIPGDATDSQGHDISALETSYVQNASQPVVVGPIVAGSAALPNTATTINNANVIATYATANFTGTLSTGESASVSVGDPVINTSTKTVNDLNGGQAAAGDVLEYTITINETAGFYTPDIQVTDVVDANLNNITFTTLPAGSTNNTAGNNIDVSTITLPANGSVIIVYEATIGGAVVSGTTIDNTAVITHAASSVTYNAVAPTIIVSNNPPAAGLKNLYLSNLTTTQDLDRIVPTGNTNAPNINGGATVDYDQSPVFQSPFVITGSTTVNVYINMARRNGNGARTAQVDLFNGGTGALIGSASQTWNAGGTQYLLFTYPIAAAGESFAVGDFVRVRITNNSANNRDIRVRQTTANNSMVQMQSSTVINVDSIDVYSAAYPSTTKYSSYAPGSTVYIRSTVSDPFGSTDINSANISITDPTPTVQVNNAVMPTVAPSPTGATRIFEYPYVLPATPEGFWNISITANEGTEGSISHTAQSTMIIGVANITISKNTSVVTDPINAAVAPKAIPNSIIEYSVDVSNSGYGYVDIDTTVITDPIPAETLFYFGSPIDPATFIDGTTSSGLSYTFTSLSSTTDDIDFSNDGGSSYITPTTDANGFDTTSPPINSIRINPKGEFNGSDGVNNPSMQIKFRLKVN